MQTEIQNQTAEIPASKSIIASFSENLFWDVDPENLDMEKHSAYIVGRALDYGFWQDWKIISTYYGIDRLRTIAMGLRVMFPQTLSFIAVVTQTPEEEFRCYTELHSKNPHWVY